MLGLTDICTTPTATPEQRLTMFAACAAFTILLAIIAWYATRK